MANIEKRNIINDNISSGEFYLNNILQGAFACKLIDESDLDNRNIFDVCEKNKNIVKTSREFSRLVFNHLADS